MKNAKKKKTKQDCGIANNISIEIPEKELYDVN